MFSLRSFLVRTTISLLLLLGLALEAPGQKHQSGHLYAIDFAGVGFVYLVNQDNGQVTHLYPSALGSGAAYYPKTGLWYGAWNIGPAADEPAVYWTVYASFNSENEARRTLRLVQPGASGYTGGLMAYNPVDQHFYLLQSDPGGALYFEKIDPPTGKSLGRTLDLAGAIGQDGRSSLSGFTFDDQGHLWAIVVRILVDSHGGPAGKTYQLEEFDLATGSQPFGMGLYTASEFDQGGFGGSLAYDSDKKIFYTYEFVTAETPVGLGAEAYFAVLDTHSGTVRTIGSAQPGAFQLQWGP